ncbi:hypothetical protein MMC29_002688 [Sticta canariensis]|nr:hypothetical protein [Sticta canariensis]
MNPLPPVQNVLVPTSEEITTLTSAAGQSNAGTTSASMSLYGEQKEDSGVDVPITKAIRPLNSFMAFRAYYAPIFTSLQQKYISGFLTYLWNEDSDKGKWSIVAKAYSVIRDIKGKKRAPLDAFLAINAPFMGITEPGTYLVSHGWEIAAGENGSSMLRRNVELARSTSGSNCANMQASVDDVLRNSYANGYVEEDVSDHVKPGNEVALTMATSAQPVGAPLATNVTANDAVGEDHAADGAQESVNGGSSTGAAMPSLDPNIIAILSPVFPDTVSSGATNAGGIFHHLTCEYPFNSEFMPTSSRAAFDPFGEDAFDAYDMSDVNDFSKFDWLNDEK